MPALREIFSSLLSEVICGPLLLNCSGANIVNECNELLFGMRDEVILCWIYDLISVVAGVLLGNDVDRVTARKINGTRHSI